MVKPGERVKCCTKCECWYGLDNYYKKDNRGRIGLTAVCKGCHNERTKKQWQSNTNNVARRAVTSLFAHKERKKHLIDGHLSREQLLALCGDHCAITKLPFSTERGFRPSPDRIDSSKGYVEGNVHWVCSAVNRMKWDLTVEELQFWCRAVSSEM